MAATTLADPTTATTLTVDVDAFKRAVTFVAKAGAKAKQAFLTVVELTVADQQLRLRSSDGARTRQVHLPAGGAEPTGGDPLQFGLPVALLQKVVAHAKPGELTLEIADGEVVFVNGRRRTTLRQAQLHLPADADLTQAPTTITVTGRLLAEVVGRTAKSVGSDPQKAISGAQLACNGTHLRSASTDSYRLAYAVVPVSAGGEAVAVIPGTFLPDIQSAAAALGDDTVTLTVTGGDGGAMVHLDYGDRSETLPTVAGEFPDFSQMLAVEATTTVSVDDPAALLEEIAGVAITGSAGAKGSVVQLTLADQQAALSASDESGEVRSEQLPVTVDGDELELLFNADFLADGFSLAGHRQVTVKLTGATRPVLLDGGTVDDVGFKYVLMPSRG